MTIRKNLTPLESDECKLFATWLRMKELPFTHIPNETYTTSWRQKRLNKEMGVQKGIPDYMIVTPKGLLFVEMKRKKGGVVSLEQKFWMGQLNKMNGIQAKVCYGHEEAKEFVKYFL